MKGPVLSERMRAICDMVTPGKRVVDVGCDHGLVDIYLVQQGISPGVLAMDVREGPLSRAREHVEAYGLGNYIETRLSDGLKAYGQGEAQVLVCAGMGGKLMQKILAEGRDKAMVFDELILQPQSELMEFRAFLDQEGYYILRENILEEEGKYYFLFRVVPEGKATEEEKELERNKYLDVERRWLHLHRPMEMALKEAPYVQDLRKRFGSMLLWEKNSILLRYLKERLANNLSIAEELSKQKGERAKRRLLELLYEIELYRHGIELCQKTDEG